MVSGVAMARRPSVMQGRPWVFEPVPSSARWVMAAISSMGVFCESSSMKYGMVQVQLCELI